MDKTLLAVEDLTTSFRLRRGWFSAIRNISFTISQNETLALVGESGCGKSVTALSIMRLLPEPGGLITGGRILFKDQNLAKLSEKEMRNIRGNQLAMIFQEPMTSLNPVLNIGWQVAEPLHYHRSMSWNEARKEALDLLDQVKIPSALQRFNDYPHQFSGGMRQRVMIAMALACQPEIIIADEPTTALDVTIQAQVLSLLAELKQEKQMSMIFITHDMGVVAWIADRVAVMYAGDIVEVADVENIFEQPLHPYTEALLKSIPRVDRRVQDLRFIPGQVPSIDRMPPCCRYTSRCDLKIDICEQQTPDLVTVDSNGRHRVRCWVRAPGQSNMGVKRER